MVMTDAFQPILYVKSGCPHCFKLQLFLLEAGLNTSFQVQEWVPGDEHEASIKRQLAPHFEKVTFPTIQYAPGEFQNESDALIARYAAESGVDPLALPLYQTWAIGLQPRLRRLSAENKELKAALSQS